MSLQRVDWDQHGIPSAPSLPDGSPGPFLPGEESTIEELVTAVGSASTVVRWCAANTDKAHTEDDPVHVTAERLLIATGGKQGLSTSLSATLLMIKLA